MFLNANSDSGAPIIKVAIPRLARKLGPTVRAAEDDYYRIVVSLPSVGSTHPKYLEIFIREWNVSIPGNANIVCRGTY